MRRSVLAVSLACGALLASRSARADVSSWLAVGGGVSVQRNDVSTVRSTAGDLTYSIGVGSSPLASFVVGGLLRGTTLFGLGTDVGLAVRVANGSFARGDWGLALEAGVRWRPWRDGDYGRWPLQAVLTGGSPWGLQLAAGAEVWSIDGGPAAQGFFAVLEVDLLRLTVTRQGGSEQWWYNPNPAGGRKTIALAW